MKALWREFRFAPAAWVAIGVLLVLVATHFSVDHGFSRLINFGERWEPVQLDSIRSQSYPAVKDSAGYDGQFYVQLATDPTLREAGLESAIDAPAYRARRILMPALAWLIGAGQVPWVVQVYALLNVICWLLLAWLVIDLLPTGEQDRIRFMRWFGIVFSLGALESVRLALVDLPSLLFIVIALRFWKRNLNSTGACWIVPAVFTKETSILAMAGYAGLERFRRREWLSAIAFGAAMALGYAGWMAYVHTRFAPYLGGEGNLGLPLAAWLEQMMVAVRELRAGRWDTPRYYFGIIGAVGLVFQLVLVVGLWDWRNPIWRVGVVFGCLLLFLGTEPWKSIWAAARIGLPLTLAFNLLLPGGPRFHLFWWLGNAVFLLGLVRFIWT